MVLEGHSEYTHHFNPTDALSASQKEFIRTQWQLFRTWWSKWPGAK
jgi:4-hydroxy-tetrahydrodipicolinate synthase